jgi:hypothetical protein
MCAWVASLYPENCIPCGSPPKDVIWIPKVDSSRIVKQPPIELDLLVAENKGVIPPAKNPVRMPTHIPAGEFRSGTSRTAQIGFINRNDQECLGTRGVKGNDHNATAYKLACRNQHCGHVYGANGTDIHIRKCPECQNGAPGIAY